MYKVADYLISAQKHFSGDGQATLRPLDTRGPGSAVASLFYLLLAMLRVLRARLGGGLAGVHVNMAERMSLLRKGSIVVLCWLLRVPVIIHLHGEMRTFYRRLPGLAQRATRWMFSRATSVVVIGTLGRLFVGQELGVPDERIDVVENGVPGPACAPYRAPLEPEDVPNVLFVGRLCDAKGVEDLLQAAALAQAKGASLRLTFAGGGADLERYTQLAQRLGIAAITNFAGWCDEERVRQLLDDASVLVLPSHDEVLPLVVLEALAQGVPVICTPVGELPYLLQDGVHVRFVPVRDPASLAGALKDMLDDPDLLLSLGANGRRIYEERFSMARFFSRIARVHALRFGTSAQVSAGQAGSEVNA